MLVNKTSSVLVKQILKTDKIVKTNFIWDIYKNYLCLYCKTDFNFVLTKLKLVLYLSPYNFVIDAIGFIIEAVYNSNSIYNWQRQGVLFIII